MYLVKMCYYDDVDREEVTEHRLIVANGIVRLGEILTDLYNSDAIIEYTACAIGEDDDNLRITEEIAKKIKTFYNE